MKCNKCGIKKKGKQQKDYKKIIDMSETSPKRKMTQNKMYMKIKMK